MSDELKAAAERYREHDAKWKAYLADENRDEPPSYDKIPEDSCLLADAYLAEQSILDRIETHCLKHNNPSVNPEYHRACSDVLKIIRGEK